MGARPARSCGDRGCVRDADRRATRGVEAIPTPIAQLGIAAYWFPTERKVMTTEGRRLISVFVVGGGLSARRARTLGIAVARTYLGANDPAAAGPNGT